MGSVHFMGTGVFGRNARQKNELAGWNCKSEKGPKKIVGRKGRRRLVELPLRENEIITDEGKLVYFILKGT